MKSVTTISAFLSVVVVISMALIGYAQPNIPKEDTPSDIPADVRQQIERLYSSRSGDRAKAAYYLGGMGERAAPAIPFLTRNVRRYWLV